MRFSDGAFIPFEEDKSEKSEEIGNGSNGKVCREKCGDTFRRDCFNIATIGAFGTPFVGGLLAATGAATDMRFSPFAAGIAEGLLLVSIYNHERGNSWLEFMNETFMVNCENKCKGRAYENLIDQENDEKLMKVLNMTIDLTKACQEYKKVIADMRSSQEKFHLKDAPKLVKYETVITRIAFLTQMFEQSNQAKSEEERKMLRDMYLEEAKVNFSPMSSELVRTYPHTYCKKPGDYNSAIIFDRGHLLPRSLELLSCCCIKCH